MTYFMNCYEKKPEEKLLICPPHDFRSDDCPPRHRRTKEFDPHNPPEERQKPDPRPPLPCRSQCCECRPAPLGKKPMVANLKLRQLADAYNCRVSEGCHNRRKVFYDRWQTYLDRLPPMPNTDYTVYSCNDYVDLGVNNDYMRYDTHLPLRDGPRTEALKNFLWMKNLGVANAEVKKPSFECAPIEPYSLYSPPSWTDSEGVQHDKRRKLYLDDGSRYTHWGHLMARPEYKNFVEGATPCNTKARFFRKDSSFTNPVDTFTGFSSGNNRPFKEIRDLKMM